MLTCSGVKQNLNLMTVNPAVENTLSAGVDIIGMVRYLLAIREARRNLCWFLSTIPMDALPIYWPLFSNIIILP